MSSPSAFKLFQVSHSLYCKPKGSPNLLRSVRYTLQHMATQVLGAQLKTNMFSALSRRVASPPSNNARLSDRTCNMKADDSLTKSPLGERCVARFSLRRNLTILGALP